ncbi:MAG: hypothetical protein KBA03_01515, partial [Anaerolineaceae bacterium]|nr:hypothetical protein [Anaerolineaceae bacterium]
PEEPISPEEPIVPEQSTEPEIVEPVIENEVIPEVVFHSEPDPIQSQPFVYDPVLDESEPYIDVTPKNEGFESAPAVDPSSAKPPADDKKTTGWVIALIVILLLCLCICCGVMVVSMMIASGQYQIEWSSLLSPVFSMLSFF